MRYALVLLNARAGALIDSGGAHIREQIARSLSQRAERVEIRLLEPLDMPRAIAEAARGEPDTLIVGGGDGSASLAAEALAGGDKLLGVLPLGTMNLLARDLGMPADPHEAAAMLAEATPRRIDLASVNGRPFHTLSGLGFFSQMARAREETRGHPFGRLLSVGVAAFRALRRAGYFAVEVTAAG
jgi:diacylglycerol kinase family enzyme